LLAPRSGKAASNCRSMAISPAERLDWVTEQAAAARPKWPSSARVTR